MNKLWLDLQARQTEVCRTSISTFERKRTDKIVMTPRCFPRLHRIWFRGPHCITGLRARLASNWQAGRGSTGVPPVNQSQDAPATFKEIDTQISGFV